ncbi:MAG: hypothetical protein DIZ77_04410 [endosymbiont of Seepiophila jonesi]|uniref:Uncharacterized protein n=1 Tax=endosymbiont of Lamellibrachia luymesi TaxID=2200907 RepID=A0A370DPP3_9GAMM|nr:MAG: hypothetical protein DIZ79_15905 [endosymbiont of Lamellibrachia luymesi]RDH93836.1 MAG: hypothetical protein DIZ77_04410 [endosymbiont of Seepiophila jonesi]
MENLTRYRKHSDQAVTAVQLDLDTIGFVYQKWGAEQRCKQGDWLVDNNGDTYTIDTAVFARTYRKVAPGRFVKTTPVWARQADHDGSIKTIEGESHYSTGDYLVFNNEDGTDGYCMSADSFHAMYEMDSPA